MQGLCAGHSLRARVCPAGAAVTVTSASSGSEPRSLPFVTRPLPQRKPLAPAVTTISLDEVETNGVFLL